MLRIAVLIPCYNEEVTIAKVIKDVQKFLPNAQIYVYDNNSKDNTAVVAKNAGVIVRTEFLQGKGNVIRSMFSEIDADYYIILDGDATYDVSLAPSLIKDLIDYNLDLINVKIISVEAGTYRKGHRFGNKFLTSIISLFFKQKLQDVLSGYKGFSKAFVKNIPIFSTGFSIEVEIAVWSQVAGIKVKEVDGKYFARPDNSFSKLSTYKDGLLILKKIGQLISKNIQLANQKLFYLFYKNTMNQEKN